MSKLQLRRLESLETATVQARVGLTDSQLRELQSALFYFYNVYLFTTPKQLGEFKSDFKEAMPKLFFPQAPYKYFEKDKINKNKVTDVNWFIRD